MKYAKSKFVSFLPTILVIVGVYVLSFFIPREELQTFIVGLGSWGPLVFIFFVLLTYIFAPISGTSVLFVGFYLFGSITVVYSTIAAVISVVTNFWIARTWGRSFVQRLVGSQGMEKIDRITQEYGLGILFAARVFLSAVHDFISYAAGLTNIRFVPYFTVSLLGKIPGNILWYYLAGRTDSPIVFTLTTFVLIAVFGSIFMIGHRIIEIKKKKDSL